MKGIIQWSWEIGESIIKVKLKDLKFIKAVSETFLFIASNKRLEMVRLATDPKEVEKLKKEYLKEMLIEDQTVFNSSLLENIWLEKIIDFELIQSETRNKITDISFVESDKVVPYIEENPCDYYGMMLDSIERERQGIKKSTDKFGKPIYDNIQNNSSLSDVSEEYDLETLAKTRKYDLDRKEYYASNGYDSSQKYDTFGSGEEASIREIGAKRDRGEYSNKVRGQSDSMRFPGSGRDPPLKRKDLRDFKGGSEHLKAQNNLAGSENEDPNEVKLD